MTRATALHLAIYALFVTAATFIFGFMVVQIDAKKDELNKCKNSLGEANFSSNVDKLSSTQNYTAQSQNNELQVLINEKNEALIQVKQLKKQLADKDKLLRKFKARELNGPKPFELKIGESKYVGEAMLIFKDYFDNTSIDDECTISIDGTTETWRTSSAKKIGSCTLHLTECNDPSKWSYRCRY